MTTGGSILRAKFRKLAAQFPYFPQALRLAAGRTTVVITHRFSTARIADMIHVMSEGQVIERGSHDDLLAAGGRYAQGWIAQAHV